MRARFPAPGIDALERMIASAYEQAPAPDPEKIKRIGKRLTRKRVVRHKQTELSSLPWWIIFLLTGGFATAAWLAGEQWLVGEDFIPDKFSEIPTEQVDVLKPDRESIEIIPDVLEHNDLEQDYKEKKSPVIYQREAN